MNVGEFKDYLRGLLVDSGNPAIAGVDFYHVAHNDVPLRDLAVRGADGVTLYLDIVRTAPPGGDKPDARTVAKTEPGVTVITRE